MMTEPAFSPVSEQPDHSELELRILERWRTEGTFEALRAKNAGNETFSFIDGIGSSLGSNDHLIQEFANLQGVPNQVSSSQVRALFSHNGQSQAIAYSLRTAVPEPGVWSLMIVGFFGAGSLLRKSRRRVSTAG